MATPQTVRHLNKVRALNTLFRQGAMTRASLARSLGLNRSSIGFIVDELLADGLVREREIVSSRHSGSQKTGRPGIHVQIDPNGGIFLGAEIGVDHVTIAAIDLAAREIRCDSTPYAVFHYPPTDSVAKVGALLNAVIGSFRDNAARIKGICIAVPALVRDGVVCNGLMLGWRDVELRRELASTLCADLPIVVENDANAFAIGETYKGAVADGRTVAFLLIENGVGGGIVIDGHLFRGAGGFAGEFGQMLVCPDRTAAAGRGTPHLECIIGKDALLAAYKAAGAQSDAELDDLLSALRNGDLLASGVAADWADHLARGLVNLTNVLNPERVILGGSVALVYAHVETRVLTAMRKELLEGFPLPSIELSRTTVGGAAVGAACLMHQNLFSVDESLVFVRDTSNDVTSEQPAVLPKPQGRWINRVR